MTLELLQVRRGLNQEYVIRRKKPFKKWKYWTPQGWVKKKSKSLVFFNKLAADIHFYKIFL